MENDKIFIIGLVLVVGIFLIYYMGEYSGLAVGSGLCEDDDGSNIYVRGTLTYTVGKIRKVYVDSCINENIVNENYCKNQYKAISDPIPCPYGEICELGVCKKGEPKKIIGTCRDTDSGSIYVGGVVYNKLSDGRVEQFRDICATSRSVSEYNCKPSGEVDHIIVECPNDYHCEKDACVR